MNTTSKLLGCLVAGLLSVAPLAAQEKEPVLKGKQITESALIDALAIDSPADTASGATRGFRPSTGVSSTRTTKAGPGKSSLLITFAPNSADLMPETKTALDTLAKALQSDKLAGFSFRVEGHADPRGGAELNQTLSQQRADAVVKYLTTTHGILPDRLAPQGKGSSELMNPDKPEAPENRRVTIVTNRN